MADTVKPEETPPNPVVVPDLSEVALAEMFEQQAEIKPEEKPAEKVEESQEEKVEIDAEKQLEEKPEEKKVEEKPIEKEEKTAEDDLEDMRARLDALARAKLDEWAMVSPTVPVPAPAPVPITLPVPKQDMFGGSLIEDIMKGFNEGMAKDELFLSQEEIDELVDKPGHIQVALNKARRKTAEEILRVVPAIVDRMVNQYGATQKAVTDFYDLNKDLNPYRNYVSVTFKKILMQNKEKNLGSEELLKQTAENVRKDLRLAVPGATPKARESGKPQKPAFAGSKVPRGRAPKDELSSKEPTQQDYMADILKGL